MLKVVSGLEQSEEQYRQAVDALEEVRAQWQAETEACLDLFQDISSSRLRVLRDTAWLASNIGSAACVSDDAVYEESRQVLETAYSEVGGVVQDWIAANQTGEEVPGQVVCQWAPTSSTLGMGHMRSQQQLSYDTASLGRCDVSLSCGHLADLGRSRSDLGVSQPPPPPRPPPPALMSPKKPPRMFHYNNNISPAPPHSKKPHTQESLRSFNVPISKSLGESLPTSRSMQGVENGEYFSVSSSDYNSDMSLSDHSPRGRPPNRQTRTQAGLESLVVIIIPN